MTAEETRKAMGTEFAALAERLREDFGAKLVWLKTDTLEIGKDPALGSVPTSGKDEEIDRLRYWYGRRAVA